MKYFPPLSGLLLAMTALTTHAAPVPHPDRPDRLVETRDGLSVEYSPGQEPWMEMAFERMRAEIPEPTVTPSAPPHDAPTVPGSARDLHERRAVLLAAVARQVGLPAATELQGRAFDTFLGYYDLMTETVRIGAREIPTMLTARRLAIWQRDDMVGRLRAGAVIEGISYDPKTDSGRFNFNRSFETPALKERLDAMFAAIDQERLKHTFSYEKAAASASFTLNPPPTAPKAEEPKATATTAAEPDLIIPIIYRGNPAVPDAAAFGIMAAAQDARRAAMAAATAPYRNPTVVSIILHETAEIGLLGNIITSPDRRWLCDGTANYVAWRVARDLLGPDFAAQVYNLDSQLRLHAAQQSKINLVRWSATEHQKAGETETDLNRAHYAFATRAMFLIAEKHGEGALALLWGDVAKTPKKKVTAKTFADAYRKRFKGDLAKLVREAEQAPIPAAPPVAPQS